MKVRHFDTQDEENNFLLRKQQRKKRIANILLLAVSLIIIICYFIFRKLDRLISFIREMKNAESDDIIFVIVATTICVVLAVIIYKLFTRKKKFRKFSFLDFSKSIAAALGIMLICGFLFMCIKAML